MQLCHLTRLESHAVRLVKTAQKHARFMALSAVRPNTLQTEQQQSLQALEQELLDSIAAVQLYQQQNPLVPNLPKLMRRIRGDLNRLRQLQSQEQQDPQQFTGAWRGVLNNVRGYKGELMALNEAPGVVAVCKRFRAPTAAGHPMQSPPDRISTSGTSSSSCSDDSEPESPVTAAVTGPSGLGRGAEGSTAEEKAQQHPAFSSNGASPSSTAAAAAAAEQRKSELLVEVDVVADDGLTWIEVKNQELFGVASGHYVGGTHGKGLAEQVAQMLAVAALPEYKCRGRSPQVVVFFPSGVDAAVATALTELGAKVADGPGSLAPLCGLVGNSVTNLDVTTLCALVSEVSWRDPSCKVLQDWAQRTSHWRECLTAQQQRPLLAELEPVVGQHRRLVVSCAAVAQFEVLMQQFAGPLEQQRWAQLLQRLEVYHCSPGSGSGASSSSSSSSGSGSGSCNSTVQQACIMCGKPMRVAASQQQEMTTVDQTDWVPLSPRLNTVEKMTPMQQAVFSLGDALHALTVTANGSMVRAAAACGVAIDAQQHRPVWLTGL